MANLVKDAVYGPVRKCQLAKHFARIMDGGQTKYMPILEKDLNKWHPSQIVQKTLTDLSGDELKVPDVDMVKNNIEIRLISKRMILERLCLNQRVQFQKINYKNMCNGLKILVKTVKLFGVVNLKAETIVMGIYSKPISICFR